MKVERILMPTDFSDCANAALTHAVVLARQFEAELHLLNVVVLHQDDPNRPGETFPGFEDLHRRWEKAAAGQMKQLLAERPTRELTVFEAQRRDLAAAPAILEYATSEDIDLIILGTHGRRGLRRLFLGSVTEEVVRSAPCPVLTLRDDETGRFHEVNRIVVPFDFSADSHHALDTATELAAKYSATIDLVHVIEPPMQAPLATPFGGFYALDFDYGEITRRMETEMSKVVQELGASQSSVEVQILEGSVAPSLTRFARDSKADLIVLASHGIGGLQHFLLGSVAEKVLRSASCPVLTLRRPAAP